MFTKSLNKSHSEASQSKESHRSGFGYGTSATTLSIMRERSESDSCMTPIILKIEETVKVCVICAGDIDMEATILAPFATMSQIAPGGVIRMVLIVDIADPADLSIIAGIKFGVPSREDIMRGEKVGSTIGPGTVRGAIDTHASKTIGIISGRYIEGHADHHVMKVLIGAYDIKIKSIRMGNPCVGQIIVGSSSYKKLQGGDCICRCPDDQRKDKGEKRESFRIISPLKYN